MTSQQEILSHYGYFSYEITGKLIEKLRNKKDEFAIDKALFRKILTLMVEVLENNYKYMENLDKNVINKINVYPKFIIKKEGLYYKMESGNPILDKDIKHLRRKIDHINSLEYEELKELYKNTMSEGIYDNQRGAGLGIMKMARVSKNKILYSIENIEDNIYYYTIEITIPSK